MRASLSESYDWMSDATCAQTDPDAFHPKFPDRPNNPQTQLAKSMCAECISLEDCLVDVSKGRLSLGIKAGMGPREQERYYGRAVA